MTQKKTSKKTQWKKYYRPLVGTALAGTSLLQLVAPVLAEGIPAGTVISNTATATYQDPNNATISTQSNTVVITVAEVAGITLDPAGATNVTNPGGVYAPGNTVNFSFLLTNTGNDPSKFVLPTPDTLNSNPTSVINGQAQKVTYFIKNPDGSLTTPPNNDIGILAGGAQNAPTVSINPGQQILVVVETLIDITATSGNVSVSLGNTSPVDQDNQLRQADSYDVYTQDNPDDGLTPGEITGAPINGIREAMATQSVPINVAKLRPFVRVQKTTGTYTDVAGSTAGTAENDTLAYGLNLTVASNITDPDIAAAAAAAGVTNVDDLRPNTLTITGGSLTTNGNYVLVSDVLPVNSLLSADLTAPTNWTAVYSDSDPATTTGIAASWNTDYTGFTGGRDGVKQIGWVYTGTSPASTPAGTLAKGSTATFTFTVKFNASVLLGSTVRNIAQVFGNDNDSSTPPGTPIFDESGDTNYNNDSDNNGTPDASSDQTPTDATNGDDTSGNNTGTGPGGENTPFVVPIPSLAILNGTRETDGTLRPDAVGPTNNNDDFTNGSSAITPTTVPSVSFTNSLRYTGLETDATNDGLQPITLTLDPALLGDLPAGTTTITFEYSGQYIDPNTGAITTGTRQVVYTVNKTSPSGSTSGISVTPPASPLVVAVPESSGGDRSYSVKIDLPDNTPRNAGYEVPIIAFVDANNDKQLGATEDKNITIDRVYTGYITLLKKSRINGGVLDTSPKVAQEGDTITYAVEYTNISEPEVGGGLPGSTNGVPTTYNVTISATNFVITEDGTANGNNWALDLDGDSIMDTRQTGTPTDTNGGTIATTLSGTYINKYTNTLATLNPGVTGTFSFNRIFDQTTVTPTTTP